MKHPSPTIWKTVADDIGTDIATLKAVFEVEAAGKFFNSDGSLPRRFEPHHFPRQFWDALGFTVKKGQAAWRASLKLSTSARRAMFDRAENINTEDAFDASSWGAPQIMGFNAELAGHNSAVEMVDAMQEGADQQVMAFFNFVVNAGLDTHLRSQNWLAFAAGYNGDGQAPVYAAKIESAYRRQSGGRASATTLRVGSRGAAVEDLQEYLNMAGHELEVDGHYGAATMRAVRAFQNEHNLTVDGIAGAHTQRTLQDVVTAIKADEEDGPVVMPRIGDPKDAQPTATDLNIRNIIRDGGALVGGGGVATVLGSINENAQTILIGGIVAGAVLIGALYVWKRMK